MLGEKIKVEPATTRTDTPQTEVGSVFVSNYPPYSFWSEDNITEVQQTLQQTFSNQTNLGLYLHIPFCRKRCKFCYFRVYTDKNSQEIERYLDLLSKEVELYADMPAIAERNLHFIYFGGGTPSLLPAKYLEQILQKLHDTFNTSNVKEITLEANPGEAPLEHLKDIKSLGIN